MMRVQRLETTAVINDNLTTITRVPATLRLFNRTGLGCIRRCLPRTSNIESVVSDTVVLCNGAGARWPASRPPRASNPNGLGSPKLNQLAGRNTGF
jgi:hypothetical protein